MPASTGMAPDADFEHLYFGNNGQDPDILAAYSAWDSDQNGPHQGSSSFAGCEATPATGDLPGGPENPTPGPGGEIIGNPNQDAYEALLKEAVELGRTMFNSAGDLGANGCPQNVNTSLNGVTPTETGINNYPSSSDWVTTVGGTVLYWNGDGDSGPTPATRALEYSWAYSGGGTSFYISAPPWQQGMGFDTDATSAPGVTWPCTTNWETPSPGPPVEPAPYPAGTLCRGLPDVDAQSGDVISNGYFAGGGTSLSSPLWLGMWTRIQAAAPVAKDPEGLGFASRAIYANNANASNYERDFFDIGGVSPAYDPGTTNTNTVVSCDPQPGPYSCSGSGWDYASGWGTPKVTALMQDLDGGTVPTHPSGPAANTPEAPVSALLVLLGAAVVGVRPARARWLRRGAQRRSPPGPGTATAR